MSPLPPREEWKRCALCGELVHPQQEMDGRPRVDGVVCSRCHYSYVVPTRKNNGIPSRWHLYWDNNGKFQQRIVRDDRNGR